MNNNIVSSITNFIKKKNKEININLSYKKYLNSKIISVKINGNTLSNISFIHILTQLYEFIGNKEDILKNTILSNSVLSTKKLKIKRQYYIKKLDLYIYNFINKDKVIQEIINLKQIMNIDIVINIKLHQDKIISI